MTDQSMWPLQYYFRVFVQDDIKAILSRIGFQTHDAVKVLLIGLAINDDNRHAVCIEPNNDLLVAEDLNSVEERTVSLFEADPRANITISHPRIRDQIQNELFLNCRARAIAESIEKSGKYEGLTFFVSESAPHAGYRIHTCIGLPADALKLVPCFNNPENDHPYLRHIEESFVQTVINMCLRQADRALYFPDPGSDMSILGDRTNIIRNSASRFVNNTVYALGGEPNEQFESINRASSLTYERSRAKGQLAFAIRGNLAAKLDVTFQDPVGLHESRTIRKLLELTDEKTALLADSRYVYGLGKYTHDPIWALVTVKGHAEWTLGVNDTELVRVKNEQATLPHQVLSKDTFVDVAQREVDAGDPELIWQICQCALESGHGTTIVVSKDPESEVKRLGQVALAIEPVPIDPEDVVRLGRVDGATLLGPDGTCYAFGMILDGRSVSYGDRARGSRYNSALRYQRASENGTMVIVISDDGNANIIPTLEPRIYRQEVEEAVQTFFECSGIEDDNGEEWANNLNRVKKLAFYLNEEQCQRVNMAYEKEMSLRQSLGTPIIVRSPLQPNPDMNDSYFID